MVEWAVVYRYPAQNHNAIRNSAQVGIHWIRPIGLLDLGCSHERIVDRLNQALVDS